MKFYSNISVIIISFKSQKSVIKIIKKIHKKINIIIIDNSMDKKLKKKLIKYKNVKLYFKNNIGYGTAVNYARKKIKTRYFLLLNPDIKNYSNKLLYNFYLAALKLNNNFLSLGPNYYKISNSKKKKLIVKQKNISGACMFLNTSSFDKLNGFDEKIFLYFEENDLCKRGNNMALYSYKLIDEYIKHNIGTSVEIKNKIEKDKLKKLTSWHFIWSKYYYFKKHYGLLVAQCIFMPIIMRCLIKILYYKIVDRKGKYKKYFIRLSAIKSSIMGEKSYYRIEI